MEDELKVSGVDCSDLFNLKKSPISFKENPRDYIPTYGSMVYTIWNKSDEWIYVGIGGIGRSPTTPLLKRNPISRILQHKSGRRSGDQFCIYVHDYYVIPNLDLNEYVFDKGYLDNLTREFINNELFYRFLVIQEENSIQLVRSIEDQLKTGLKDYGKPLLNGVP